MNGFLRCYVGELKLKTLTPSNCFVKLYTDLWIAGHGLTLVGIGTMDFHSYHPTSVYRTRSLCVFLSVLLLWTGGTGASAINSTR